MGLFSTVVSAVAPAVAKTISTAVKKTTGSSSKSSGSSSGKSSGTSSGSTTGSLSGGSFAGKGSGAVSSVNVYDDYQHAIKSQMEANSRKWWTASSQAEKDALHAQNVALAQKLGDLSFDSSSGKWSGSASAPVYENFYMPSQDSYLSSSQNGYLSGGQSGYQTGGQNIYQPADQSAYLRSMAAEYLKQQQEALKAAYRENVSSLDAEGASLTQSYEDARNAEAAQSALAQRRFFETANAYGLNSGTIGQEALSFASEKQTGLSELYAAEAAANAELERQRTQLSQQYQSALTQAQAANNYQLFQKLYDEAARVDEAITEQKKFNASQLMQRYQTALNQYNTDRDYEYKLREERDRELLASAQLAAQSGDYSQYGKYYGWDDAQVNRLNQLWQAQQQPEAGAQDFLGLFRAAKASGSPATYLKQKSNYAAFGFDSAPSYTDYKNWLLSGG